VNHISPSFANIAKVAFTFVILCMSLVQSRSFYAAADTYDNQLEVSLSSIPADTTSPFCAESVGEVSIKVAQHTYTPYDQPTKTVPGCIQTGKDIDIGTYRNGYAPNKNLVVRTHGEEAFHELVDFQSARYSKPLVAGTNMYVASQSAGEGDPTAYTISVIDDLRTALVPIEKNNAGMVSLYELDSSKLKPLLPLDSDASQQHHINSHVISSDGKHLVAYIDREKIVKLDLETMKVTQILKVQTDYPAQPDIREDLKLPVVSGVSANGQYVFVGGKKDGFTKIIDMQDCNGEEDARLCWSVDIDSRVRSEFGGLFYSDSGKFNGDGSLTFNVRSPISWSGPSPKQVSVRNFTAALPKLDYLALGDSYTSGEGDMGKQPDGTSYYTADTDIDGGCHLSTRSYPFLLRDYWKYTTSRMQSVACSGATIAGDYGAPLDSYFGQHEELRLSAGDRANIVADAFARFIPGRIPQLEFVKKNKPKVITLTGSGNDVGFSSILRYCAGDIVETAVFDYSCEYVKGGALNEVLNDMIDSQYAKIRKLIQDIQSASPDSKIYYIGYPSFIAGSEGSCALNNGALNGKERDMINEAVSRLNGVISSATAATGTHYIDIESALTGGRMCEGSEYVTGVADATIYQLGMSSSFHPNAQGHAQIAKKVEDALNDPVADYHADSPKLVAISPDTETKHAQLVSDKDISEGDVLRVTLEPNTTAASSQVIVVAYSEPTPIGTYQSNSDGSVDILVRLPRSLSAGLHLLTLTTTSPTNEPLRLFQYIPVLSNESNDLDGDGVMNADDKCMFIKDWYETSGKNICASESSVREERLDSMQNEVVKDSIHPALALQPTDNLWGEDHAQNVNFLSGSLVNTTKIAPSKKNTEIKNAQPGGSITGILFAVMAILGLIGAGAYVFHKKSTR
jgi:lysophospholipase L1-like esterase